MHILPRHTEFYQSEGRKALPLPANAGPSVPSALLVSACWLLVAVIWLVVAFTSYPRLTTDYRTRQLSPTSYLLPAPEPAKDGAR